MARPQKKGIDYFSHDVTMSEDKNIKKLEARHGIIGYAIWNKLLEQIYKEGGDFNLQNEDDLYLYAKEWGVSPEQIKEVISFCIHVGLFENDSLTSERIRKNLKVVEDARVIKREKYNLNKGETSLFPHETPNSDEFRHEETPFSSGESTQSKVKESKVKKCVAETHTLEFETLHNYIKNEKDYKKFKEFDLEHYFSRVNNYYLDNNYTLKEMKSKIWFFIDNDIKSKEHEPVRVKIPKTDSVTVAYELVKNNLEWIKSLPDKNPDEVVPELIKRCKSPATKDTLFEAYVEKAFKHYLAN